MADAARRIIHGKTTNAGQNLLLLPDYALVPKDNIDEFVNHTEFQFQAMYGQDVRQNTDYTSIVNDRHLKRIQEILKDAQDKGATVSVVANTPEEFGRRMPVQLH